MTTDKNSKAKYGRMRFLASVMLSSPAVVFVYSPLLVVQTIAGIAVPFATGCFIDALIGGTPPITPFAILAALMLVKAVMTPCLQRFILSRSREIELMLQKKVLGAIIDCPPSELSFLTDGTLVAKMTRDTYAVGGFVSGLYPRLLIAGVTMIASGCALHSRSPALSIAFMAFIPLSIAVFIPFARRFASTSHAIRQRSDTSFSILFDFFYTLPFLQILNAGHRFADSPHKSLAALKDGNCSMDRLTVSFGALFDAILVVGEVAVLGIAGMLAAKGSIPVGDVVVYQLLFLAAMQSVQGIVSLLPETSTLREGIDSLGEILSRRPQCREGDKIGPIKSIEFRNVSFSYPGAGGKPIIQDFSAMFRAGRIVALSGANGAGKTTLLKLASAALVPQSGEILVNGKSLLSIDMGDFRERIGIVFQDSLLATGTVRDNITLRNPAFTEKEIEKAMTLSGLDEVVKRLPDGLETFLGLRGMSLSGGELQRLAIARALVCQPDILILDEVTNHLDVSARTAFGKLLRRLASGRIILLVSHDEAIINLCDEKISCQIPGKPPYIRA